MRIAIDLTSLAHNYSGIEHYALRLTQSLARIADEHEFVLLFENEVFSELKDTSELPNVRTFIIHPHFKHKLYVTQRHVTSALKSIDTDVQLFPAFPQPLMLSGVHSISVIHDVSFWDCPETFTRASRAFWRASAHHARRTSTIVTVSEFSRMRINARLGVPIGEISIVPNGIDASFSEARTERENTFYDSILHTYGLPRRFILSLCTLEPRKNLSQIVKAWVVARELKPSTPDLVLAGRSGWKVKNLLEEVPASLVGSIHITGFIDSFDLPHLYHLCERFVCASRYEGFGLPPLEALAAGAPVACSDIPVFHETCEGLVTFFSLNDTMSLARIITESPHYPTYKQLGELCNRYSWQNSAQSMLETIERSVKR